MTGSRSCRRRPRALANALAAPGVEIEAPTSDVLHVTGVDAARIGQVAADHAVVLHQLVTQRVSLEAAFMSLTSAAVDYRGHDDRSVA